ncbi:hypothetical protein ACFTAO_49025 [Paenibacillus rhizoplanae]
MTIFIKKRKKKPLFLLKMELPHNHFKGEVSLYIQYTMDQLCLPMDLEEDIPEKSPRSRREYRRQSAGQRHFF